MLAIHHPPSLLTSSPRGYSESTTHHGRSAIHARGVMDTTSGTSTQVILDSQPTTNSTIISTGTPVTEPGSTADTADTSYSEIAPAIEAKPATPKPIEKPSFKFTKPSLLAHTAYPKSLPHPSTDLIQTYSLNPLALTVARNDPITGEKINRLRRSYEGHIKAFSLAGRNKAIKYDPARDGVSMIVTATAGAEDFYNARVAGKEITKGLSSTTMGRLAKVLELVPGPVPRNAEWENALGVDRVATVPKEIKKETKDGVAVAPKINGHINGVANSPTAPRNGSKNRDENRPKRAGKKRRYNDESFEGYGEGFDEESDGDSDTGSRRSIGSRKRVKTGGMG